MIRALTFALALLSTQVSAIEVSGPVRMMDGDTFAIGGQVIRLHGVDAFENGQDCTKGGRSYNCGATALNALRGLVGTDTVHCSGTVFDDYDRLIGVCHAGAVDLSAALVRAGYGLAYVEFSDDYVGEEREAEAAGRGAWAGEFVTPWTFRANGWANAAQEAPDGQCCVFRVNAGTDFS